jgi:hypothetical protein
MNFNNLPPEIQDNIFKFLSGKELLIMACVSSHFYRLIRNNKNFARQVKVHILVKESGLTDRLAIFKWSLKHNHLDVTKWAYFTFNLHEVWENCDAFPAYVEPPINYINCKYLKEKATYKFAEHGNLEGLKWWHSVEKVDRNSAFYWALVYHHLHILKWLKATFSIGENMNQREYTVSYKFPKDGNLQLANWLVANCKVIGIKVAI